MTEDAGNSLKKSLIRETLHFLGWRGEPLDDTLIHQMRRAQTEMTQFEVRKTYGVFSYSQGQVLGTILQPEGDDIRKLLFESQSVVLLSVTLGDACERYIRKHLLLDAGYGMILDATASAMIEAACDQIETELFKSVVPQGGDLTDRFSPGYGDMPLAQNKEICSILETGKRIGLTTSSGGLLIPQKSVTAIIGISDKKQIHRASPCENCKNRQYCPMAKEDSHD